jgi:pyridoxine 5-phosphate synthase
MKKVRLGVNIDHAATLRQVRGGETPYPDLLQLSQICAKAGADQITIHLREDRRHIQVADLKNLSHHCPLLLNLEMAPTDQMVRLAKKYKPDWACFVPEKRAELTTRALPRSRRDDTYSQHHRRCAEAAISLEAR